jgi:hypothetical protein
MLGLGGIGRLFGIHLDERSFLPRVVKVPVYNLSLQLGNKADSQKEGREELFDKERRRQPRC